MTLTGSPSGDLLGDRIGRLALVEWPDEEPAPSFDALDPPAMDAAAVLLVRRVVVVTEPVAVRQAVDAELHAAARTASRPVHGSVDIAAEAVLFADPAELLASYLLWQCGAATAPGWVWEQLAGSLPPPSLTAVVGDPATPLSAVLAVLDAWGRLGAVVDGINAAARRRVVQAVAERHDLWVRPSAALADGSPSWGEDEPSGQRPPAEVGAAGFWELGRRGAERVLGRVSAGPWFAASLGTLARVLVGEHVAAAVASTPPPGDLAQAVSPSSGRLPTPGRPTTDRSPRARWESARRTAPHEAASIRPADLVTARDEIGEPGASRRTSPTTATSAEGSVELRAATREDRPAAADTGVATGVGGVLYLANCYTRLDLAASGLHEAAPWDVVDGLGRAALSAVDALDETDRLWDLLAGLAGRSRGERPAPAVLARCCDALADVLADLDLGADEPQLGELVSVSGHVRVDLTRVDLYLPLEAVHLSVRRRALDADPGWVPALGRVIRFHFAGDGA